MVKQISHSEAFAKSVESDYAQALSDREAESVVIELVRADPLVWWESCVKILDKRNEQVSPVANILQQRVAQ